MANDLDERSRSPHHRCHLAEGALVVAGVAPLLRNRREQFSHNDDRNAIVETATILASGHLDNKSDHSIRPDDSAFKNIENDQLDTDWTRHIHDSLKAGYDSDQLSLAGKLQEDFSSGGKKAKKDIQL